MVDKFQASNRSNSAGQPFYAAGTYVKAASRQGFQQRSSTIPNEVEKHPNSTAFSPGIIFNVVITGYIEAGMYTISTSKKS